MVGQILDVATLPAFSPRRAKAGTATYGEVFTADGYPAPVDQRGATHVGRGRHMREIQVLVIFATSSERANLSETLRVRDRSDALTNCQPARTMLASDIVPAATPRMASSALKCRRRLQLTSSGIAVVDEPSIRE